MGCQSSKLDHQQEEMLPKLPPVLSRKLEEIKRRKAGATLSKKQLLKDGLEDDCVSGRRNDSKSSVSSAELLGDLSIGSAKVAPEPTEPEEKDEKDKEENGKQKEVEVVTTTMEKLALEEQEDEQKVEEHGGFRSVEDSLICPRSPSFRLYLIDSLQDKENNHGKEGSLSDTDVDSIAEIVESQTSTEAINLINSKESTSKIKKRGRSRMRSFRRVIPKGKPVKNFLSVKSCYYPSCGGQDISRQFIAAKPATT